MSHFSSPLNIIHGYGVLVCSQSISNMSVVKAWSVMPRQMKYTFSMNILFFAAFFLTVQIDACLYCI